MKRKLNYNEFLDLVQKEPKITDCEIYQRFDVSEKGIKNLCAQEINDMHQSQIDRLLKGLPIDPQKHYLANGQSYNVSKRCETKMITESWSFKPKESNEVKNS